jgi:hypothetical protein
MGVPAALVDPTVEAVEVAHLGVTVGPGVAWKAAPCGRGAGQPVQAVLSERLHLVPFAHVGDARRVAYAVVGSEDR